MAVSGSSTRSDLALHAPIVRVATFAMFLICGFVGGSWASQIPVYKASLGVGPAAFSIILFSVAVGAVIAMPVSGALIGRFGTWPVLAAMCVANPLSLIPATLFPTFWAVAASALLFGATTGSLDVAMNAKGLKVEIGIRKPIMSALHGTWSIGMFCGVSFGGFALGHMPLTTHAMLAAGFCLLLATFVMQLRIGGDDKRSEGAFALPSRVTLGIGALTFLALMLEGAIIDWAAIYLKAERGIVTAEAGYGLAVFAGAMALVRFTGDGFRARFGATRVVVVSAMMTAFGMILVGFATDFALLLGGFLLAGLGIGNIAPILFGAGGIVDKDRPARGIAAVTTMGYSGFLIGPPTIGLIAEYSAFSTAFLMLAGVGIVTAFAARPLIKPYLG